MLAFLLCTFALLHLVYAIDTPVNITTKGISPSTVRVTWSSDLKNRTGDVYYRLRYKAKGMSFTLVKVLETERVVKNLKPNTTYLFSVSASRGRRLSDWSPAVSWTTHTEERRSLDVPRNLKIRFLPSGSYKVKWKPPIKPKKTINGYTLTWKLRGQVQFYKVATRRLSHVVTLNPNSRYVFKVQYIFNGGKGPYSTAVDIFTSKQKSRLNTKSFNLHRLDQNTIAVTWESQTRKRDGYRLQFKIVGREDLCTVVISPGENSYNITNVSPDKTYKVRIAAQTQNGTDPFSKWQTIKPQQIEREVSTLPPTTMVVPEMTKDLGFISSVVSAESIKLTWTEPENMNVLAYTIELYKGEQLIKVKVYTNTTVLIDSLEPGTTYTCNLVTYTSNGPEPEVRNVTLTTLNAVVPQITAMKNVSVSVGWLVRLQCRVTGDPLPSVFWAKGGSLLDERVKFPTDIKSVFKSPSMAFRQKINSTLGRVTKTLLIRNIRHQDSGLYVCSAANAAGEDSENVYISVFDTDDVLDDVIDDDLVTTDLPTTTVVTETTENITHTPTNLTVIVLSSSEAGITWEFPMSPAVMYIVEIYRLGDDIDPEKVSEFTVPTGENRGHFLASNLEPQSTHQLIVSSVDETGATNSVPVEDVSFTTFSISSPEILRANKISERGDDIMLQCMVRGDPIPNVSWKRDDLPYSFNQGFDFNVNGVVDIAVTVDMSELSTRTVLHLPYSNDTSNYTCTARNEHGVDIASLSLHPQDLKGVTNSDNPVTTDLVQPTVQSLFNASQPNLTVTVLSVSSQEARIQWDFPLSEVLNYIIAVHLFGFDTDIHKVYEIVVPSKQRKGQFLLSHLESQTTYQINVTSVDHDGTVHRVPLGDVSFTTSLALPPFILDAGVNNEDNEYIMAHCLVRGDPIPDVWWKSDDLQSPLKSGFNFDVRGVINITDTVNSTFHTTRSELRMPYFGDINNYTCTAQNIFGVDTAVANVVSSQNQSISLGPVRSVTILTVSQSEIQVEWSPPDNAEMKSTTYNLTYKGYGNTMDTYEVEVNATSYLIKDLRPFVDYKISIQATNANGEVGPATSVSFSPHTKLFPSTITVTLTTVNSSTIMIEWLEVNTTVNHKYQVQWKRGVDADSSVAQVPSGNSSHILTGLDSETTYLVRIIDLSTGQEDTFSEWVEVTTQQNYFPNESRPPPPPVDVFLVIANSAIHVEWLPPSTEYGELIRQYHVRVSKETTDTNRFILPSDKTSVIVSGIEPGMRYTVGVRSVNNAGESDPITRTVILPEQGPVRDLNLVAMSPRSIFVSWEAPSEGTVTGYELGYSPVPGAINETARLSFSPQDHSYTIRYLKTFAEYTVGVRAISGQHGSQTTWGTVRTLSSVPSSPPQDVSIVVINSTAVRLTWTPPPIWAQNGDLTGYTIMHKAENIQRTEYVVVFPNNTQHTLTDLIPDTTYMARIATQTVNGTGPLTQWFTARTGPDLKTAPDSPDGLNITSLPQALLVHWNAPINDRVPIQGYIVGYGKYIPEVHRFIVTPSTSQFIIEKLKSASKYVVSVRAFNMYGESHPVFTTAWTGLTADDDRDMVASTVSPGSSTYQITMKPLSIKGTIDTEVIDLLERPQLVDVSSERTFIRLELTFSMHNIDKTKIRYLVNYKRKNSDGPWDLMTVDTNHIILRDLKPGTAYFMSIQAISDLYTSQPLELTASTSRI